MSKFKIGDQIECVIQGGGFEKATVLNIFTDKKGRYKDREMYLLKIPCGTATVPVSVENNYQLKKDD